MVLKENQEKVRSFKENTNYTIPEGIENPFEKIIVNYIERINNDDTSDEEDNLEDVYEDISSDEGTDQEMD